MTTKRNYRDDDDFGLTHTQNPHDDRVAFARRSKLQYLRPSKTDIKGHSWDKHKVRGGVTQQRGTTLSVVESDSLPIPGSREDP